jgi:beta-glucosidase
MRRLFKFIFYALLAVIVIILSVSAYVFISSYLASTRNMDKLATEAFLLDNNGYTYRDLNKNKKLDVYEDSRQPLTARVDDILSQMNLEEKAGMMFINAIVQGSDGSLSEIPNPNDLMTLGFPSNSDYVVNKKMNHFNLFKTPDVRSLATWHNNIQKLAERTRLGIPVTIATDPRNHFSSNPFTSMLAGAFSQWPEPLGFAALGDSVLMQKFGDIARQEYRAAGIHLALHPMADLATEPRWPRINGTFGEDAKLTSKMVYAYIKGFQGDSLTESSVACMTKHFSGGGPQNDGLDPHFTFQKGQVYPGRNFDYHLIPFNAAFAAGTAQIMPYYGVPIDQTRENVGFSFNKDIITGLLREQYHFDGVVCTDWGLISDIKFMGIDIMKAKAHGVEGLSAAERMLKIIDAGIDQIGGEHIPEMLIELVRDGKITEARLDQSVRRLLRDKFRLGLFDNPYLDVDVAVKTVGRDDFMKAGADAQRKSMVLLKNGKINGALALPLKSGLKIYVKGIDVKKAAAFGLVVDTPEEADVAIIRIETPYKPGKGFVEGLFHHGDLDFKEPQKTDLLKLLKTVPTIVNIYLDRPAVIPDITEKSAALIANFGAEDDAVLDVVFGNARPQGKLPIELPSSMQAVAEQFEDVPHDSKNPLFPFGFGLNY